jgi:hypothetical protein
MVSSPDPSSRVINASLQYLHPDSKPSRYNASLAGEPLEATTHEGEFVSHVVTIENGRERDDWNLDQQGFKLVNHPIIGSDLNFFDDAQLESKYNAQIQDLLLRRIPGATEVYVFDHTRRSSSVTTRHEKLMREPSTIIHNDYTAQSAKKRIEDRLLLAMNKTYSRFMIINVWRPINGTVESWPLCLCDSTTVDVDRDLVPVPRVSKDGRIGGILMARHNATHRWFYFPGMSPDEALVFKSFDSSENVNQYTIHSAFDNAHDNGNAKRKPRESLETRAFVLFA